MTSGLFWAGQRSNSAPNPAQNHQAATVHLAAELFWATARIPHPIPPKNRQAATSVGWPDVVGDRGVAVIVMEAGMHRDDDPGLVEGLFDAESHLSGDAPLR